MGRTDTVSENEKRGMERVLAILRSKQSQAVDEGNGFRPMWSARNKAFKECAEMLRLALEAEAPPKTDFTMLLRSKAEDIRTEYQLAYGCPCDCSTADGALHYGRAQGLELAADIIGADPTPAPRLGGGNDS